VTTTIELQDVGAVRRRHSLLGILAASLALSAGPASAVIKLTPEMTAIYAAVEVAPPTASQMTVCYGFACRRRMELAFSSGERATLLSILARGRASPAAERKAIQRAFVWFDRRVGRQVGTSKRVAYADIRAGDDAHNFDCWDTTRDALSLLLVLQEWGALHYHTVSNPRYRGNFLIGQLPHNTAVIRERASGMKWIVDMWTTAYGHVPDVMPLTKWLDAK
jgi:hypothetical protein